MTISKHSETLLFFRIHRNGEDWSRLRKVLASKLLHPKDIRENLFNFNAVTRDAIEHMVAIRGADDVIPDLEGELAKFATECKFQGKCLSLFVSKDKLIFLVYARRIQPNCSNCSKFAKIRCPRKFHVVRYILYQYT